MELAVILVTRLNGAVFALNVDLIERADATPDTVVTLVDGTKYVIAESLTDLIDLIRDFRASIIALAQRLESSTVVESDWPSSPVQDTTAKVLRLPRRER
jgi:flagellar protein FlbD